MHHSHCLIGAKLIYAHNGRAHALVMLVSVRVCCGEVTWIPVPFAVGAGVYLLVANCVGRFLLWIAIVVAGMMRLRMLVLLG